MLWVRHDPPVPGCLDPEPSDYRLTEKGLGLYPVIVSLLEWGNRWLDWAGAEPPVQLVDRATGEVVEPTLVDARTGKPLDPRATRAVYVREGSAARTDQPR